MIHRKLHKELKAIGEKLWESAISVLPIVGIVSVLCFTLVPIAPDVMLSFYVGALLLVVGMGLFALGAEVSMTPIGSHIGTALTRSRKVWLMLGVGFLLGVSITVAEPDLQVLAETVPHIDNTVLLLAVGLGVGALLAVCMVRILLGARLRYLLCALYLGVFALAACSSPGFLSVAFDAGGVTTGPMTVPFILALGVGISNIRSDRNSEADSFGLVALCSIGPVLSVLLLGLFYRHSSTLAHTSAATLDSTVQIAQSYLGQIPKYLGEMCIAFAPIVLLFFLFQLFSFRLNAHQIGQIGMGLLCTYVGLVLFLTGVNVGFSPLGLVLGQTLAQGELRVWLIPLAMVFGWFLISAEPAVKILQKQIEEVSAGAISARAVKLSLSVAIALAMGLAMLRALCGIPILVFLLPGYALAIALSFVVPDLFTAIAFDAGGVASGPMTATFMLQFTIGVCRAQGGNVLSDAFGLVAMVAMLPLITVQVMGWIATRRKAPPPAPVDSADWEVIELWEVAP